MLTRLKVSGFKNLADVDVYLGPFTCIAGPNGAGKSNLFDAIHFLSMLADHSLQEAALSDRGGGGGYRAIRDLFQRSGDTEVGEMSFEAELLVPKQATDEFGLQAVASATFLRYSLTLAVQPRSNKGFFPDTLRIIKEELIALPSSESAQHVLFPNSSVSWQETALHMPVHKQAFITSSKDDTLTTISLHREGPWKSEPPLIVQNPPRTVLSFTSSQGAPTAFAARYEMRSWRVFQLEPSALRKPDEFGDMDKPLGENGSHIAATLYRLALQRRQSDEDPEAAEARLYAQVANRLHSLVDDVHDVLVDRDDGRELLTLQVMDRNHTKHAARSLSEGTLRFLALAVLEQDQAASGLACIEEPENGLHPDRITTMISLLKDMAVDTSWAVGGDNPLRQVIINTHSPSVVSQVPEDSLLLAQRLFGVRNGRRYDSVRFIGLPETWRQKAPDSGNPAPPGALGAFLNPVSRYIEDVTGVATANGGSTEAHGSSRRVMDRPDLSAFLAPVQHDD